MTSSRRALIASDSIVSKDPRVLKQVRWLIEDGWTIDTLGRGSRPEAINGKHFEMPLRPYLIRVLANLFLPIKLRYRVLIASTIPQTLVEQRAPYDLAILNEIELLPWFLEGKPNAGTSQLTARAHLDLHEYSPSQRSGMLYSLVFKRYRLWMTRFIPAPAFATRTVVSPGIAELYMERFSTIPRPGIVRNCPDFTVLEAQPVDPDNIRLIHHGGAVAARGIAGLIEAMKSVDDRFSLHLMLVGAPRLLKRLKSKAKALRGRVQFTPPVPMTEVAARLNHFDLEVIFYPPVTENMKHALPNKIFEAVQGRLGVVVGQSPDMMSLVNEYGNGAVVNGWTINDLAKRLNQLTINEINAMKQNSDRAALECSAETERRTFLQTIATNQE